MSRNQPLQAKFTSISLCAALAAIAALLPVLAPSGADARPKTCFGKKINRVVKASGTTVRLKFKDVAWVSGKNVTVIGKPYSRICAGAGRQVIRAGKGKSFTDAGPGNDRIILHPSSNLNRAYGGLGDDVIIGSNGHDFLYGGPKRNPRGLSDRDVINGRGGNDRIYDYSGSVNLLIGGNGSDRIYSLGDSVSILRGGNGSDFLYSNGGQTESGQMEMLFGERGNDRLRADRTPNNGPAYFDGGSGDDWVFGTSQDDTIIYQSGITKINAGAGDDLIIATSTASATVDGGPGRDRISFAKHTPPGYRGSSGVMVDLAEGFAVGSRGRSTLTGIEDVTGSSFDDQIIGRPGRTEHLYGGMGNDHIVGQHQDQDQVDGGLGQNTCEGVRLLQNCGLESPGRNDFRRTLIEIDESGVLTVVGSNGPDQIEISYDPASSRYVVDLAADGMPAGRCFTPDQGPGRKVFCPVDRNRMNGILVYGHRGDDRITVNYSVPARVTSTINAGTGRNMVLGGKGRDQIFSEPGSAGSVLNGRHGGDDIRHFDAVTVKGGPGHDTIHTVNPCVGGVADGGPGTDNMVFAGAPRVVHANLGKGFARLKGGCARPLKLRPTLESLEGSNHNDHLVIGRRHKSQQGNSALLGRGGIDILNSRNGRRDSVTTGDGGRRNKVIADRKDKVIWGWGLSAY